MNKRNIINFLSAIFCQVVILAFGLIIPKITVSSLGSEANGFLSTINEIFVYISLVEAGLGLALLNALYKPIHENDKETISGLLTSARRKYKVISVIYFLASIVVGIVYPLFLKSSSLSYWDMCLSIVSHGIGGASTLFLSSCLVHFITASGHNYVKQWVHLLIYILTSVSKIVAILLTGNIIIINVAYAGICVVEGLIYTLYFKKKFKNLSMKSVNPISEPLKEQKYFLVHQISGAIFGATDLMVISIFCSLNDASIYSVYSLLFTAIATILTSIFDGLKYMLGDAYAKNLDTYKKIHDIFEAVYLAVMFALMFVAYSLANGFIGVYMANADINYVNRWLPLLFVVCKILSSCRAVTNNTQNISHHARQNIPYAILESIINLTVSLVLVHFIGVYGVLFGTIAALLFRTNQTIMYSNKVILHRSSWNTYKYILLYSAIFSIGGLLFELVLKPCISNYLEFIIWGVVTSFCVLSVYAIVCLIINKDVRMIFFNLKKLKSKA